MTHQDRLALTAVGVVAASTRLSGAFATQDVSAALSCFAPHDQVMYLGMAKDERAEGRRALGELFERLFARPAGYGWDLQRPFISIAGDQAVICSEAVGVSRVRGAPLSFGYRITGSLQRYGDRWLWRVCHGATPVVG